jgi:hypothetical protein
MSRKLLITTVVATPDETIVATTKTVSFPDEFAVSQALKMLKHHSSDKISYHAVKLYFPTGEFADE